MQAPSHPDRFFFCRYSGRGVGGMQCGDLRAMPAADCGRELLTQEPLPPLKGAREIAHTSQPHISPTTRHPRTNKLQSIHFCHLNLHTQILYCELTIVQRFCPLLQHVSIHKRPHRVREDSSHGREASSWRMGCPQVRRYKCRKVPGQYSGHCQVRFQSNSQRVGTED